MGVELMGELQKILCTRSGPNLLLKAVTRIVVLLLGFSAHAQVDLNIGGSFRSYPLSGVAEVQSGYGLVLWGDAGAPPWYGYVRPVFDGATAGIYNSAMGSLEVFPLSFLGGRAGGESIQNDSDYTAYKCENFVCKGRFYRTFAEAELSLGAGPVFVQGRWRRERWTQKDKLAGDFIDPTSGLLLDTEGESQTIYQGILGYKITDRWTLMGGLRYAEIDDGFSRFGFGLLRWSDGEWTVALGGGNFESELKSSGASVVGFIKWDIWPSVALK